MKSLLLTAAIVALTLASTGASAQQGAVLSNGQYIVIGWNDLGMHCISPRFAEMAILPPYNTVWAVVIRRGEEPKVVTSSMKVSYSLDNNTTVKGKTDFWTFAPALFGKNLPLGIGLTGLGLSGQMTATTDHFQATGIPALPYNDKMQWNPFQRATIKVTDARNRLVAQTSVVVPVSDEMDCAKCHATGKVAARAIKPTPTLEGNIISLHDLREKTGLMAKRPVLCASCHSDNALGTPGAKGVSSLSLAMHKKHANVAQPPACYDCHPGVKTQCNRSAAPRMGPVNGDPKCANCHGDLKQMTAGLVAGRQPWVQEPTCAQCHGSAYSTGTTLYRNAKGHGGIYCAACHNSPHAWYPSKLADDAVQPMAFQHVNKAIGYRACFVCHTDGRKGIMPPHGDDDGGGD